MIPQTLYKLWNTEEPNFEWITMLDQIALTSRQNVFVIFRNNATKIGMNTTSNKIYLVTSKISLDTSNYSFVHFKKIMKIQFLNYGKT